jgi:predicted RNA-binding protein with PUA-like domain
MALWLCKQEPISYSYDDLVRDGSTVWDGVSNPLARQHLRKMQSGDRVLFYHTGKEKAVVGEMRAVADARPDPSGDDPKAVVVEVEPVRALARPVSLERIKEDATLADWDLVRLPRLSVVPVSPDQWRRVEDMSRPQG